IIVATTTASAELARGRPVLARPYQGAQKNQGTASEAACYRKPAQTLAGGVTRGRNCLGSWLSMPRAPLRCFRAGTPDPRGSTLLIMNQAVKSAQLRVVIPADQVQKRVREMARQISDDYRDRIIHVLGILENGFVFMARSEEHTSELQSRVDVVCRLLLA